jgi:hypothetical protein
MLLLAVPTTVHISYAQFGEEQQQQQEVESDDGGLTATLNGETFTQGDPITVRGTVGEKEGGSLVYITIVDPDGIKYGTWTATVTNDLTFTFGFIAGQPSGETRNLSMDKFGTYTIMLMYAPQGERVEIETTDVSFEYVNGITTTPSATGTETNTTTTTEEEEDKSYWDLQEESLQTLKNQSGLTADQRNLIKFLEQQIAAQRKINPNPTLGSSSSSPPTAETNTTTMTLEEAEAAIANATKAISEAEYKTAEAERKIERAEELADKINAAANSIDRSTSRITEYTRHAHQATYSEDDRKALDNLDLISKELESIQGNLTNIRMPTTMRW